VKDSLKASLEIARHLYSATPRHNGHYIFGIDAYDILINGLRRDDNGFAAITQYGTTGNGIILLTRLIDARRAAYNFWSEKAQYLSVSNNKKMLDVAELYNNIVSTLNTLLPNDLILSTQNGFPFEAWSSETRVRFVDALINCKQMEQQALKLIIEVLERW
jgi:hypothetical protein